MTAVPKPPFVAILNESPIVVLGVTALLRPFGRRVRIAAYADPLPKQGRADVVLYDPFSRPNTTERVGEIAQETGAQVLVFTWEEEQAQIDDAMKAGAAGYMSKTVDGVAMMAAIEEVAASRDGESAPSTDESIEAPWPGGREGLSNREAWIVSLIVVGMSNQGIASALYLSMNSVTTSTRSAFSKMGVTSRTQAIAWGIQHGFAIAPQKARLNDGGLR